MTTISNLTFNGLTAEDRAQQRRDAANTTKGVAAGGATVVVANRSRKALEAVRKLSQAGNKASGYIQTGTDIAGAAGTIKTKYAQKIINILEKCSKNKGLKWVGKLAKSPVTQKVAGAIAGFVALTTVAGGCAKVIDTAKFLDKKYAED